jgi:myo-inositol-1(or 4)-monophosphatase
MELARAEELLETAIAAAREAGEVICRHYRSSYDAWDKSPDNPVTTADLEADHALCTRLRAATPDFGWLSEETADSPDRLGKRCCWVVDPLDGTKEFIEGRDQFAVSVALVEDGFPLLGVVHNPATGEMFSGIAAGDATCTTAGGVRYNDEPARPLSDRGEVRSARILVSDSEVGQGMWTSYQAHLDLQQVGSAAYKLARMAVGFGDATISLKPKHEWDICAGVALVVTAGGQVTDLTGRPPRFNQPDVIVNGVVAANPTLHARLLALLSEAPRA